MSKFLLVELKYSAIARDQRQKDTLRGLGLRRRHQIKVLQDTPSIRGMIQKVFDLVSWKEVGSQKLPQVPVIETYRLGPVPTEKKEKSKPAKTAASEKKAETAKPAAPAAKKAAKKPQPKAEAKAHAAKAKKAK